MERKEEKYMDQMEIYEKIKQIRSERDLFSKSVGITNVEVSEGYGKVEAKVLPEYANTCGTIHGGLLFSMADSACANAAMSDGLFKTTLNCTFDFLRAGKNPQILISEAREVKRGRTVSVYDATVTDEKGTLLARGTFTYFNLGTPVE